MSTIRSTRKRSWTSGSTATKSESRTTQRTRSRSMYAGNKPAAAPTPAIPFESRRPADPLNKLPAEVICEILRELTPHEVVCMSMVCRSWKSIVEGLCVGIMAERIVGKKRPFSKEGKGGMEWEEFWRIAKIQHTVSHGRPSRGIKTAEQTLQLYTSRTKVCWIADGKLYVRDKAAPAPGEKPVVWDTKLYRIYSAKQRNPDGEFFISRADSDCQHRASVVALGYDSDIVVFWISVAGQLQSLIAQLRCRLVGFDLQTKQVLWARQDNHEYPLMLEKKYRMATPIYNNAFTYMFERTARAMQPLAVIHALTGRIISELAPPSQGAGTNDLTDHMISPDGMFFVLIGKRWTPTVRREPWNDTTLYIGDTLTGRIVGRLEFQTRKRLFPGPGGQTFSSLDSQTKILAVEVIGRGAEALVELPPEIAGCEDVTRDSETGERWGGARPWHKIHDSEPELLRRVIGTRENLLERRRLYAANGDAEYSALIKIYEYQGYRGTGLSLCSDMEDQVAITKTFRVDLNISTISPPPTVAPEQLSPEQKPPLLTSLRATIIPQEKRIFVIPNPKDPNVVYPYGTRTVDISPNLKWALQRYNSNKSSNGGLEVLTFKETEVTGVVQDLDGTSVDEKWAQVRRFTMDVDKRKIMFLPMKRGESKALYYVRRGARRAEHGDRIMMMGFAELREEEGEIAVPGYVLFF